MTINSTTRKTNNLAGNGNTHTYPFAFKVFTDSEIVVKKLEVSTSIETTLNLGVNNDYIVTLNQDQNGNPGGSITLKSGGNNYNLPSGFQIVITSAVQSLQGTDLTNQGGFYPEVINDALDKSAILHQQQQGELDRSIKFSLTNTIGSLEITENANARKNKVMAFDNAGEFSLLNEIGTYRGNWAASTAYVVRDLVKDTNTNNIFMCNAAHTSSGAQPLTTNTDSAKWDLIVDAATATTSSTNAASSATAAANSATAAANSATAAASSQTAAASSASTASTKATQADTAKTAAETAKTAAETAKTAAETALDSFDDRYLGTKSSNPTLDNDGNALVDGALYFNTTVNRMRVYDLGNTTWLEVTIVGSDLTNTNTVAGSISNVNTVAGSISGVNAVANNATNINAVNSNSSNINTVAGSISNVNAVAGNASNVNTVASNISNVNAIATDIAKIQTVANDLNETVSEIETAANDLNETTSEIDTVANAITNVDNVGNNIANVNTVAGISSNVTSVAGNATNVNTVAGAITNVNNVGGSIANVNTCATNLSGINSFAERYRTDNTGNNPSTSLHSGDLFFNQGSGKLLVYNGNTSAWEETQSVGNFFINTIGSYSGTGGNSATFNGSAYKFTLSNAGQFAQQMLVSVNGVVQKPNAGSGQPSEGFALDGANIVFSAAPPSGADYFIVTIGASVSIGTPSNNTVTSAHIVNGTIVNEDINASAAIALSKLATSGTANNTTFLRGDGAWTAVSTDLVGDTSPQLGGTLDTNGQLITFGDSSGNTNNRLKFGASSDLKIYHDGTESRVQASNGPLDLRTSTSHNVEILANDKYSFWGQADGMAALYHNGTRKFETTSSGVSVSGNCNVDGNITLSDNEEIQIGNSTDFRIYHDSNNSFIRDVGTGTLSISGNAVSLDSSNLAEYMVRAMENDAVELYYNGSKKLETATQGIIVKNNAGGDDTKLNIVGPEGRDAILNLIADDGDDNADHWRLLADASGDDLWIQNYTDGGWETNIRANGGGQVELYYNNSKRLETASGGIKLGWNPGTDPGINAYYDDIVINNSGTASGSDGGCGVSLISGNASWGSFNFADSDHNQCGYVKYKHSADEMYFGAGTYDRMYIGSGGFFPASNNSYNLGSSSLRWANVYSQDLHLSNEGISNDVDGTWGSYTIQEGAEDLFLINKRNGKKYKFNLTEVS